MYIYIYIFFFFYKLRYSSQSWLGKDNVLSSKKMMLVAFYLEGVLVSHFASVEKGVSPMCPHILCPLSLSLRGVPVKTGGHKIIL